LKYYKIRLIIYIFAILICFTLISCSSFTYRTYDKSLEETQDDPEPNYSLTLNPEFQNYTNFMYIGNRVENFGTYFNTFYNSKENFNDAYEDYVNRVLANYGDRLDSIYITPKLSQESIDKFTKCIEKASKVIQYHKSSDFMDKAVLMIGEAFFYLGDYLKAERKFSEFVSKLNNSPLNEKALLFLSKTQLRLGNTKIALESLERIINTTNSPGIKADAYQTIGEYYLSRKDYQSSISNYKKAIEFSSDDEFKAQMQYLVASVISRSDSKSAAYEFDKVSNFDPTFELEYFSRKNQVKNLIISDQFSLAKSLIDKMRLKYKDYPNYLAEIEVLDGRNYFQKKDYKKALSKFKYIIYLYPGTVASSDASFYLADYYDKVLNNYLNTFSLYTFSVSQNLGGLNTNIAQKKVKTFKRYFELHAVISNVQYNINTDSLVLVILGKKQKSKENEIPGPNKEGEEPLPKGKGQSFSMFYNLLDTSDESKKLQEDSLNNIKEQNIIIAKFELAELFQYELNNNDSAEYYLLDAFNQSKDYDYKSKVLFALANLYRAQNLTEKTELILKRIVDEYPNTPPANESRKMLNLPLEEFSTNDLADSIYSTAEQLLINKQYTLAIDVYKTIINNYISSKYAPVSYYAIGWIYENTTEYVDSAYMYYSFLNSLYPKTQFTAIILPKIQEYELSKKPVPDSSTFENNSLDSLGNNLDSSGIKEKSIQNQSQPPVIESNENKNKETDKEKPQQKIDGEIPTESTTDPKK
jgi:TolA-binding protein